jgi:hypothetical protein
MAHTRTRHHRGAHHPTATVHTATPAHSNLGKSPTNSQKLIYIANKLGLKGIAKMQGSSFNLFDTVDLTTGASPQVLTFFLNANGKGPQFSNFQQGNLRAGEAMILERVAFFLVTKVGLLTDPNAPISDVVPLGALQDSGSNIGNGSGIIQRPGSIKLATAQIKIANQTVVKSFNCFEQIPDFNPQTTGISKTLLSTAGLPASTAGVNGNGVIPMEAPPVLPPNLTLEIDLQLGTLGTLTPPAGTTLAIMCVVGRFGSIFASKTTL